MWIFELAMMLERERQNSNVSMVEVSGWSLCTTGPDYSQCNSNHAAKAATSGGYGQDIIHPVTCHQLGVLSLFYLCLMGHHFSHSISGTVTANNTPYGRT